MDKIKIMIFLLSFSLSTSKPFIANKIRGMRIGRVNLAALLPKDEKATKKTRTHIKRRIFPLLNKCRFLSAK